MDDEDFDGYIGRDLDDRDEVEDRIEELERSVSELASDSGRWGLSSGWVLGMAIAVTLSWSRNASILLCVIHGTFSWGYVFYFAVTR